MEPAANPCYVWSLIYSKNLRRLKWYSVLWDYINLTDVWFTYSTTLIEEILELSVETHT